MTRATFVLAVFLASPAHAGIITQATWHPLTSPAQDGSTPFSGPSMDGPCGGVICAQWNRLQGAEWMSGAFTFSDWPALNPVWSLTAFDLGKLTVRPDGALEYNTVEQLGDCCPDVFNSVDTPERWMVFRKPTATGWWYALAPEDFRDFDGDRLYVAAFDNPPPVCALDCDPPPVCVGCIAAGRSVSEPSVFVILALGFIGLVRRMRRYHSDA